MAGSERDQLSYEVIGAAMAVHTELGPGFLESVYADALEIEFHERHITFQREARIELHYKNTRLASCFRADFICSHQLLLELKALTALTPAADAQLLHYLKATEIHTGLLLNFGAARLQYKRFVL